MNCANHADASAVAYCRTCGKALCGNCTRPVKGVIYCEDCLGAKMEGTVPPGAAAFPPAAGTSGYVSPAPVPAASGPIPVLAGILGGVFPFGVGAVYTGQYAKGLAHLIIFVLLVAGASAADSGGSEVLGVLCGLGIAFFIVYQIADAVRTARALQAGQPAPDPFGLARTFSTGSPGTKTDTSRIPTGAIVLIMLGVFFLLRTAGLFEFSFHHFWPLLLILLGGWIFATRWGLLGTYTGCTCERCRAQCLMGPAILVTLGVIALIDSFRHVGFFGYVGGILLVIGGVKLFQGGASSEGHRYLAGSSSTGKVVPPPPPVPPVPPTPPVSEVKNG
jgi:Domain of unknown function (DUF5668)/B-box zinc finger